MGVQSDASSHGHGGAGTAAHASACCRRAACDSAAAVAKSKVARRSSGIPKTISKNYEAGNFHVYAPAGEAQGLALARAPDFTKVKCSCLPSAGASIEQHGASSRASRRDQLCRPRPARHSSDCQLFHDRARPLTRRARLLRIADGMCGRGARTCSQPDLPLMERCHRRAAARGMCQPAGVGSISGEREWQAHLC